MSSPMQPLIRVGHQPHPIDRKKYGMPRFALYYASRTGFLRPGIHLWTGTRNVRILPLPRRPR